MSASLAPASTLRDQTHGPDATHDPRRRWDQLCLLLICGLSLFLGIIKGASIPFWADELATVGIAGAPTWHDMLLRGRLADLNPPLEPTLVRLSFSLFGPHEFAGRLPSVLGFTVALACLFLLLRRRVSLPWAVFGALLPLVSDDVSYYLTEARPYAVLLAMLGIALLAYDTLCAGKHHLVLARIALLFAFCGLLLSHIFGAFAVAAFLAAEALRTVRRRQIDAPTWAVLLLPLLCCLTYAPLFHAQGSGHTMIYQVSSRSSFLRAARLPYDLLFTPVSVLMKIAFILLFFLPLYPKASFPRSITTEPEIWVLLAGLFATPFIVALVFHFRAPTSGFYPRYSLAILFPGYLLLVGLLAWRSENNARIAVFMTVLAVAGVFRQFAEVPHEALHLVHRGLLAAPDQVRHDGGVFAVRPDLPLVVDNALDFMEADARLGDVTPDRMVYVTDEAEALRLTQQNARESIAAMAKAFQLRSRVVPYPEFLGAHRQFLVLVRPNHGDWFMDEMQEKHAKLVPLGTYRFAGQTQELWLATPAPH